MYNQQCPLVLGLSLLPFPGFPPKVSVRPPSKHQLISMYCTGILNDALFLFGNNQRESIADENCDEMPPGPHIGHLSEILSKYCVQDLFLATIPTTMHKCPFYLKHSYLTTIECSYSFQQVKKLFGRHGNSSVFQSFKGHDPETYLPFVAVFFEDSDSKEVPRLETEGSSEVLSGWRKDQARPLKSVSLGTSCSEVRSRRFPPIPVSVSIRPGLLLILYAQVSVPLSPPTVNVLRITAIQWQPRRR